MGPAPVCALLSSFITAFNARDFEAFRQTFADDISFFVDRPFPPQVARRTLVAQLQGSEWRIVHIHASSADTAPL